MAADHRQAGSLWTPEEDVILLRHVAKYGTKHWGYLQTANILPHRDQKACCNRFILLKRKFFQARAKGQRLTFPAVPQQPEVTSPLRRSRASSPVAAASSLGPARPATTFKRSAQSGPAALKEASGIFSMAPEKSNSSGGSMLQRTMERLRSPIEARASHEEASSLLPYAGLTKAKGEYAPDGMPPLVDTAVTAVRPSATKGQWGGATLTSPTSSLLAQAKSAHPTSATWRCFNPSSADTSSLPELSAADLSALGLDSLSAVPAVAAAPAAQACGPDALLDQFASAPLQMLFGNKGLNNTAQTGGLSASAAELLLNADASVWDSPAACADLWDLMRTATSA